MGHGSSKKFSMAHGSFLLVPGTGRTLIIKNYYIMCIITEIVVVITPKFVFVLTKFGKFGHHKHEFFTVMNNSALYKKMFSHE
jgi:hypothetical protein